MSSNTADAAGVNENKKNLTHIEMELYRPNIKHDPSSGMMKPRPMRHEPSIDEKVDICIDDDDEDINVYDRLPVEAPPENNNNKKWEYASMTLQIVGCLVGVGVITTNIMTFVALSRL